MNQGETAIEANQEMLGKMSLSDLKALYDYIDEETDLVCHAMREDDAEALKMIEDARNEMVFLQQEMEKRRNELFFK